MGFFGTLEQPRSRMILPIIGVAPAIVLRLIHVLRLRCTSSLNWLFQLLIKITDVYTLRNPEADTQRHTQAGQTKTEIKASAKKGNLYSLEEMYYLHRFIFPWNGI